MSTTWKALGLVGLVVVGLGTLVVLNWDAVSTDLVETLDAQTEKTQATLFRLGELMSMGAALRNKYGTEPDMTYTMDNGSRVLSITFRDYSLPDDVTAAGHALEIARFAAQSTTKSEQIDTVTVVFQATTEQGVVETTSGPHDYRLPDFSER